LATFWRFRQKYNKKQYKKISLKDITTR